MKLVLSFKTPDVLDYPIKELLDQEIPHIEGTMTVEDQEEFDMKREDLEFKAKEIAAKFVEYSECIRIEIDLETKEAKVLTV